MIRDIGKVMSVCLVCLFCATSVFAKDVIKNMQSLQKQRALLKAHKDKARELQRIGIVTCIDRKLKLTDRLIDMANRNYQRSKSATSTPSKKIEQVARIVDADKKAQLLSSSVTDCWCPSSQSLEQSLMLPFGDKEKESISLLDMCRSGERQKSAVTLQIPEGDEVVNLDDASSEERKNNFGFPQIPAASPFR